MGGAGPKVEGPAVEASSSSSWISAEGHEVRRRAAAHTAPAPTAAD